MSTDILTHHPTTANLTHHPTTSNPTHLHTESLMPICCGLGEPVQSVLDPFAYFSSWLSSHKISTWLSAFSLHPVLGSTVSVAQASACVLSMTDADIAEVLGASFFTLLHFPLMQQPHSPLYLKLEATSKDEVNNASVCKVVQWGVGRGIWHNIDCIHALSSRV